MKDKPDSIIDFLCGASMYDGYWFGEGPAGKHFWWRKNLRAEFDSLHARIRELEKEVAELKETGMEPRVTFTGEDPENDFTVKAVAKLKKP